MRINSHADLPPDQRTVSIYRYITVTNQQLVSMKYMNTIDASDFANLDNNLQEFIDFENNNHPSVKLLLIKLQL